VRPGPGVRFCARFLCATCWCCWWRAVWLCLKVVISRDSRLLGKNHSKFREPLVFRALDTTAPDESHTTSPPPPAPPVPRNPQQHRSHARPAIEGLQKADGRVPSDVRLPRALPSSRCALFLPSLLPQTDVLCSGHGDDQRSRQMRHGARAGARAHAARQSEAKCVLSPPPQPPSVRCSTLPLTGGSWQ